jgi:hypothetical protein
METQSFRDLFCAKFKCAPEEFETGVLWHCIHPRTLALAKLIWRVNPEHFLQDLELIHHVQEVTSLEDLKTEYNAFSYHHPNLGLLRKNLKVRISGQRLTNLAGKLFGNTAEDRKKSPEVHL